MYASNLQTSASIYSPQTYSTSARGDGPRHLKQGRLRRTEAMLNASDRNSYFNSSPALLTIRNEGSRTELPDPLRTHPISPISNSTSHCNNAAAWNRNLRNQRQKIRTRAATSPPLNPSEQREDEGIDGAPMEVPSTAQYIAHVETEPTPVAAARSIRAWKPPRYVWRAMAAFLMAGQVRGSEIK